MFGLVLGTMLVIGAIAVRAIPIDPALKRIRGIVSSVVAVVGLLFAGGGAVGYNDAGFCQHTRTIFGTETATCETGWYFAGWGTSTAWPHYITVAHTLDLMLTTC